MAGLRLHHLEPPGTRTGSYVAATFTEEVDLPNSAADRCVVALQALDAHQTGDTRVSQTRSNELLLEVLPGGILQPSSERNLILSRLRTIADSLDRTRLLHQRLKCWFATALA